MGDKRLLLLVFAIALAAGCAGTPKARDPLAALRDAGSGSSDGDAVGRWLRGEMFAPGGDAKRAEEARQKLDAISPPPKGMFASLARAIDDEAHGRFRRAAAADLDALTAARSDEHADAP